MMRRRLTKCLAIVLCAFLGCTNGSYSSGDRVLVDKMAYDSHTGEPRRFDVVVFKYPEAPVENGVPKNYIKRLLGLPGQLLAIFFGQLFSYTPLPHETPRRDQDVDDVNNPLINSKDLWKLEFTHTDDPMSKHLFGMPGKFEIIRKPPEVMMAMRRIVYDNDFQAKDMAAMPRWQTAQTGGWTSDKDGKGFIHAGAKKEGIEWVRYHHVLRTWDQQIIAGRGPELIVDTMDYNAGTPSSTSVHDCNWVGDLMLECELKVNRAEGDFLLELSRGINRFQAHFDLATGQCTLFKVGKEGKQVEMSKADTRVRSTGTYNLRLANFDARLTLWVDGDLPFGDGYDYPPPVIRNPGENEKVLSDEDLRERRGPTEKNDLEPASIGNRGAPVHVSHLKLWRDTYYTVNLSGADVAMADSNWSDPSRWDGLRSPPFKTMYVQPGHYLCLGDNSPASSDSRQWGVVPARLMLGRALMVYFPVERAGPIR